MRLNKPRIPPLQDAELTPEQRELLNRGNPPQLFNVMRTIAQYPDLLRRWLPWSNHVLFKSSLPERDREIVILRIGWLCRSGYEFAQHEAIGKRAGLTDADIERIKQGPGAPGCSDFERLLLTATDELHRDAFISDATWNDLAATYDTRQMMDLVFAIGQYASVSMALNCFGVQLEDFVQGPIVPPRQR